MLRPLMRPLLATTRPFAHPAEDVRTRRVPPHSVVLHNDDFHSQEFVEDVLQKVLGCGPERARQLMLEAHTTGRAVIWIGPKEGAELKAEQVQSFHEVRGENQKLGPLTVTIEPAPGA